jgi:xylulokinase
MTDVSYVLAIDLGTSGPKVGLVASDGSLAGGEFSPVPLALMDGGGAEQDPEAWWDAIGGASRRLLASSAIPPERIDAVSATAQWSGTVAVDRRGDPLREAIIWLDSRGAPHIRDLTAGPVRVGGYDPRALWQWVRVTGGAPSHSGKDPLAHILYLRDAEPSAYREAAHFLEPKDYLNLRLTGVPAATYDSVALHWVTDNRDLGAIRYHDGLLRRVGLDRSQLPDLGGATDVVGRLTVDAAGHLGVRPDTPVIGGTPDLHSAAIGSGATRDGDAHLYIGTSSWLISHVPFKKTDVLHNLASLPAAIPGRYLAANEQESAGKALAWAAEVLYPGASLDSSVYDELNAVAASVPPGSRDVVFTPWLYGERTPVEDATLRAGFHNQSLGTGRAEMIRAVFEGVAFNTRWLLGHAERFVGSQLDSIVAVGGGAQSALWCQIYADVLGRTIHQAADPLMVNVRGAGLLGHVALGNLEWDDVPSRVPVTATFEPDPRNRVVYDRLYDAFRRLHRGTRRIHRRLNGPSGRSG